MDVHSPFIDQYVEQSIHHLDWLFKQITPARLVWLEPSHGVRSFYFGDASQTDQLSFDRKTFENDLSFPSFEEPINAAKCNFGLGSFVLIGLVEQQTLEETLELLLHTFKFISKKKLTQPNGPISALSTEKMLLFVLYNTEYFRNLDKVLPRFVDYLKNETGFPIALFCSDGKRDQFVFQYASDHRFKCLFDRSKEHRFLTLPIDIPLPPIVSLGECIYPDFSALYNYLVKSEVSDYYYLLPINGKTGVLALLVIGTTESFSIEDASILTTLMSDASKALGEIQNFKQIISHGERYKQLFSVTTKFHSSMNQKEILEEVVHSIVRLYPNCSVKLVVTDQGIEPLHQDQGAMEAFLKGEIRVTVEVSGASTIYAPLKGHQGVYGVFIIKTPNDMSYGEDELSFIQLQATTAGHALENAKLYQQSQRSISDLQLINQTSQQMNSQLRMSETIPYLIQQITQSFNAEEVGFYLKDHLEWAFYPSSTSFFTTSDSRNLVSYLSDRIRKEGDSLFYGDLSNEVGFQKARYRSLMAIPMKQDQEIFGVVIALHTKPYQFTFDGFKVLQALVHHSTLALINARLRETLEKLVITDQLTQLYNRTYLNERINQSFHRDRSGVLLLIDIDNFKKINDNYGHLTGDQVLIQVSRLIEASIRKSDISARWGGEELAVYLPNLTIQEGMEIASRIVQKVELETDPTVTISCGISVWEKDRLEKTNDKLFSQADRALYLAKNSGKNRIECDL